MKIRRLQRWISEQLFGRPLKLAAGTALAIGLGSLAADAQTTLTFREGVDGYTGVLDTWIRSGTANQNASQTLSIDGGASGFQDASWAQALIRFDSLFGTGPGQIPVGSNILTATLTFKTGSDSGANDQSNDFFNVYRLTTGFDSTATWANSFNSDSINGVTVGTETVATFDDQQRAGGAINLEIGFNVANSLQTWSGLSDAATANSSNLGWLLTTNSGTNLWKVGASENTDPLRRPILAVSFVPGGGETLTWNAINTTGTWDNVTTNKPWLNIANGNADFANGDTVNFSQNAASPVTVTVDAGGVAALSTNFTHASGSYTLTGGAIGGAFTKSGAGNVTLAATNDFAAASVSAGTISTSADNPFGTLDTLTVSNNATWRATAPTQLSTKALAIGSGGATLNVDGTNTLVISGPTSGTDLITKTGAGSVTFAGTSSFTGTLDITQGSVIVSDPVSANGAQGDFNATTINVANGARFQFGSATPIVGENPDLPGTTAINLPTGATADWYVGESFGSVNLTGGQLNLVAGGVNVGDVLGSAFTSGTITGTVGQNLDFTVATASAINKSTSGTVTLANVELNAAGAIFINEGTISTNAAVTNTGLIALGTDTTSGTLQLSGAGTQTINKLTALGSAGGVIDVSNAAGNVTWAGNVSGGTLTKAGPGILKLTGTGSYSGPTNLNSGTLVANSTGLSAATTVNAANGTTLILSDSSATTTVTGLNLGATGAANLQFNMNGNPTVNPLSVTGIDGLGGSMFVAQAGSNITLQTTTPFTPNSTFSLISYAGTLGSLTGLNLVLPPRVTANLVNNTTLSTIDVNITGQDTVKWTGANSAAWDTAAVNWQLVQGGTSTAYIEGDFTAFDDSATGPTAITLAADVAPTLMAFSNNSKNYSISGAGKITGTGVLTKAGTGTLTLDVLHTSTGAITVNDGTLTINSANTFAGNLIVNNGVLNLTAANTLPNLTVNNGSVTSAVGSTFGTITQASGTVMIDGTNTIGSAAISGGSAIWTGSNSVGAILLSGGSLETRANDGIGSTGTLTMSNNALLRATTANQTTAKAMAFSTGGGTIQVNDSINFSTTGATSGTGSVTKTGTGTWEIMGTSSFTGTLDITAGSVVLQGSAAVPGAGDFNATSITVRNGGRFQFGQTTALTGENPDLPGTTAVNVESGGVVDWNVGEDFGALNISGGTVNLLRGAPNMTNATVDSFWSSGTINSATNLTISPGAGKIYKTTASTFTINGANIGSTGVFGIQEGTLSTDGNFTGTSGEIVLGTSSTSGTLEFRNTTSFSTAKPLMVDAAGGTIRVTQPGTTATFSGAFTNPTSNTPGILTKAGAGRLLLTGANTSTGSINVAEGTLAVNTTGLASTTTVSVNNSGTLEAPTTGQAIFAGLNVASGGNLLLDITALPTSAPLSVTTASGVNLSSGSSITVQSLVPLSTGTIPLIDYNTALGGTGLTGLNLVLPPRIVASLVDNSVETRVDLVIASVDFIKWQGNVSAAWDVNTTSNWKQNSDNATTKYLQPGTVGDRVEFNDTAMSNTNIVLNTSVDPAGVTFDNSTLSYSLSGTGSLAGATGIVKNGTGTVTIATNNTNSGATTINAGTLQLGNGGTTGTLGAGNITIAAGSKLEFNRSDDTTLTNVFTGTGEIVHTGTGLTTLSSNSSGFTGTVAVNAGTLRLTNLTGTHNFNATSIVVNNGGTFDFFGPAGDANLPNSTYVTVNTGGIVNWTEGETFGGINVQGGTLNLTAGVTLSGAVANEFTAGTINGPSAIAGSTAINKTTTGTVSITGSALNNTGGLNIFAGTISTDSAITNTGTMTLGDIATQGTLRLRTTTSGTITKPTVVNAGGGVLDIQEAATTITSTGTLTAQPNATLVKAGAGELQLNGTATYGDNATLQVTAGTLSLNPTAAPTIGTSLSATVASNATLNLGGTVNPLSNGTTHANVANNGTLAATTAGKQVGNITGTGTTNVTAAGSSLTASSIRQGTLSIGAGNTVTVAPNGGNSGVSVLNSLSVTGGATPTGTLDLKDNDLIVKNTDLTAAAATHALINAQVKNASNGFAWDQAGITSSTVQADLGAGTPKALGILLNNDGQGGNLFYGDGIGLPQFSGQSVNENAVMVKYTWLGDSDLNGVVNIDDFTYFQLGYGGGAPYTGWAFGDYDYNGVVDVDDFTYFQLGFGGQSGPALSAVPTALTGLGVTAVPEPGTWAVMIGLVGATALRARRWSKKKETLL